MCTISNSSDTQRSASLPSLTIERRGRDDEGNDIIIKKQRIESRWEIKSESIQLKERIEEIREIHAKAQQLFRCPICLDTFGDIVVECIECAHIFCDPCLKESLKRKEICPICRCKPTPLHRNKPIERMVAALPEACKYIENGCWASLTRATAYQHSLTCGYARFTCPHCNKIFLRHAHDEEICSSNIHPCPFSHLGCSYRARLVDMDDHLKDKIHFDLAQHVLEDVKNHSSDMSNALKTLLEIASTWSYKDVDIATENARLEFVEAMEAIATTTA